MCLFAYLVYMILIHMKSEKNRYFCLYTQQTTESETRWKEEREGNFDKYKHYIDQCRQYTTQLVELNSSQYKEIYTKSMTLCCYLEFLIYLFKEDLSILQVCAL